MCRQSLQEWSQVHQHSRRLQVYLWQQIYWKELWSRFASFEYFNFKNFEGRKTKLIDSTLQITLTCTAFVLLIVTKRRFSQERRIRYKKTKDIARSFWILLAMKKLGSESLTTFVRHAGRHEEIQNRKWGEELCASDRNYYFQTVIWAVWTVRALAANRYGWKENVKALCALWPGEI